MSDTPDPPPRPKKCSECNGPPLKRVDPDGVWRCVGHSLAPERVAEREKCAALGAAAAANARGVPRAERKAVNAGVVSIDEARAKAMTEGRQRARHAEIDTAPPVSLRTRDDVLSFMERSAGRLLAGADAKEAQAVSALARTALAALGFTAPPNEGDAEEVGAIEFRVLPKATAGA